MTALHSGIWSEIIDFKIRLECYSTSNTMTENGKIVYIKPCTVQCTEGNAM